MSHHNTGWSITPADNCAAIECCSDESMVVVEVWDGAKLAHRGRAEITALEVVINCAKHYRPDDLGMTHFEIPATVDGNPNDAG